MQATIKRIIIQNFKGIREKEIVFNSRNAKISGCNASGKTTIADAVTWALFGVDSQWNAKFEIRPLDENGEKIHNIEISVCVVFEIGGKEKSFQRQLKENWVTKRGASERTLQGNVGVYSVDGYPKSEKEYKECVAGIVSEDLFKILTSPTYFPNMKWQEQREILMRFVTDISDVELAGQDKRFADLIGELEKAPSTDDIKKKYQKALNEWKKKQAELPVRIDEAEKQKVDIDVAELELLKNALNEQIIDNKVKQDDVSKEFEERQKASDGILELKFELNDLQRKANEELEKQRREINAKIHDAEERMNHVKHRTKLNEQDIETLESTISKNTILINATRKNWKSANERVFDENSLVCSYCGQEYPEERKDQIKSDFGKKREEELAFLTKRGNELKAAIDKDKAEIEQLKATLKENEDEEINLSESIKGLEKCLEEVPQYVDISDRPESQEIQRQIAEKEVAMNKGNSAEEIRRQLKDEENELRNKVYAVDCKLVSAQKNVEIDDRIAELQKEQREVAQKVADQEKMLYLLEEFIRFKMDSVSETINSQFKMVNFILFRNQINGGLAETCECEYGGVPYASLNSAAKIQCGLDIIRTLQKFHDVYCPVFVDNRESCTEIPKMDCQVISFYVEPSCRELKIEVEG